MRFSPEGGRVAPGGHAAPARSEPAPALFRLLADSTLYRAAFTACGVPMAILDASASGKPLVHVNPAFERCFGLAEPEVKGRPFASALCRGNEDVVAGLFADPERRNQLMMWRKDGKTIEVEASAGAVHDAEGVCTHWLVTFYGAAEPGTPGPQGPVSG